MKKYTTLDILNSFGFFTTRQLVGLVKGADQNKPLFLVGMRPIHDAGLFTYETSSDEEVMVPCTVVETTYPLHQNYKIEVKATMPGYGKRAYYLSDFALLVRAGHVQIIDQTAPEIVEPTGFAGIKERVSTWFSNLFGDKDEVRIKHPV